MTSRRLLPLLLAGLSVAGCSEPGTLEQRSDADLLLLNGYVYTVDEERSVAQAVAVREGEITYVGTTAGAMDLAGDTTQVIDLDGRMLIPGLHDVHIHLMGIVERDVCDLASAPVALAEMVELLSDCLQRYEILPGEWLNVEQWNPFAGNDTSIRYPTIRSALDAVSTQHPIMLQGNDGHHGAVNSTALERAVDADGVRVGLSAETLKTQFAEYKEFVGLDTRGEPNGVLNEDGRALVDAPSFFGGDIVAEVAPRIGPILASHGITSVQDAAFPPEALQVFAQLEAADALDFRLHAAMLLNPAEYTSNGSVDVERMIADLTSYRQRHADSHLVSANAAKIFVDGVIEGNPYVSPPTLPNGAALEPYLQPIFEIGETADDLKLVGYVNTDSAQCRSVRNGSIGLDDRAAVQAFFTDNGFHPAQCSVSRGVLEDDEEFIKTYTQALDYAGFTVHAHVLGDRAARVAIEAFEEALEQNGPSGLPHTLAHLQMVRPDDVARIGKLSLNVAFTYAWIEASFGYDMMVAPFITRLEDETHLYDPDNDYIRHVYPVRSVMEAGGRLVAGSDAPVSDRSPRPFVNIVQAVTRATGDTVINADERIDIHDILAAYTINGAASLKQSDLVGSIEVGKRADLAVLDRNLVQLYEHEQWAAMRNTQVLLTLFDGEVVHALPPFAKP